MKRFIFLFLILIGPFSKSLLQADAPRSLHEQRIFFLITSDAAGIENFPGDEEIFYFKKDGTYRSYLGGKKRGAGDYTYFVTGEKNRARILATYSDATTVFVYEIDLDFKTPRSGEWKWLQKENPDIERIQRGTFRFVTEEQAEELMHHQSKTRN